jgi:multidrug resistance efflux pump
VTIVPKAAGQIVKLTREEGEAVRAGEVLVQLAADAPRAAVEEAESKVASAERAAAETQRNYERASQLRQLGGLLKAVDPTRHGPNQRVSANRREVASGYATLLVAPVSVSSRAP